MHRPDPFPTQTWNTWIASRLARGEEGRREVNHHVMELYRDGLDRYVRKTPFRKVGDSEELVDGFFADRLSREQYLVQWAASGKRLRHWLIAGFRMYLLEQWRKRVRERQVSSVPPDLADPAPEPDQLANGIFARNAVRVAWKRTRDRCQQRGLSDHFALFESHQIEGRPYHEIAPKHGVDEVRAASMARTARLHFVRSLRELVKQEGALEHEIDGELRSIREDLASLPPGFQ